MRTALFCFLLLASLPGANSLKEFEKELIEIYRNTNNSVVNVLTTTVARTFFFEPIARQGAGSGVVIDAKGHILTNFHVVEGAARILISFNDDKQYPARLVGSAPRHDLAVIRVEAPAELLKPATLGNSDSLQVGQIAIAIGNPFGMLGRTMTTGIVSALNRDIQADGRRLFGMIQTDAPINPGNSGGALLNSDGEVIGINTMIFSQSGGSVGVGFAIPINLAVRFIPDLITRGQVEYGQLGVQAIPLFPELAQTLRLPVQQGLLVVRVIKGSAAERAGIRAGNRNVVLGRYLIPIGGDILTRIDETLLRDTDDLSYYLQTRKRPGDRVRLTLWRGNSQHTVTVVLGQ